MSETNFTEQDRCVTVYVRSRKLTRKGVRVDGWQAGFSPDKGGATSLDKSDAIKGASENARQYLGAKEIVIVDIGRRS